MTSENRSATRDSGFAKIYAGIDGMANGSLPEDRHEVQRVDFEAWATTYLLPDSHLPCTVAHVCAARCGLVHSHNVDSRLARQGHARHLWYHVRSPVCLIPVHGDRQSGAVVVDLLQLASS